MGAKVSLNHFILEPLVILMGFIVLVILMVFRIHLLNLENRILVLAVPHRGCGQQYITLPDNCGDSPEAECVYGVPIRENTPTDVSSSNVASQYLQ